MIDKCCGGDPRSFAFADADARLESPQRLERLRSSGLLTARHRPALDVVTRLAAEMTQAEAAFVSLVEVGRQVVPSGYGSGGQQEELTESPISHSLCKYVVANDAPLVVGDARTHPHLSSHPAVLDGLVVAYAGFPVRAPDGEVLGALCVIDVVPRTWTPAHLSGLQGLATSVDTKIALRLDRRELHLDHARLMQVLEGSSNLILIADSDGVVRTMNRTAENALGLVVDDLGTKTLFDLPGAPPWRTENGVGGGLDDAQDWAVLKDGERRTFSIRVSTLRDPEGDVNGYVVVGDDVSARREAENLLHETVSRQAEIVQRLKGLDAQRSTFIATASHELRTPLTNILGYAELLASGEVGELTSPQLSVVHRLVRNGDRLKHLTEDLLNLDRIESDIFELARTELHVDHLAESAWSLLQGHLGGRDLSATKVVPSGIPSVAGDLRQLERVLLNLLTNAVKFTPDGGAVRLNVSAHPRGVCFEVSDTGIGISQDEVQDVFEPFFRTHEAQINAVQGSGIGLTVVRRIVESHGGEIVLTSVPGEGTRVRFTIPTWDDDLRGERASVA